MKDRKPEILYSEPIKEIMGNPPKRILRWGTSIMFLVFVIFILFAWIVKYPDAIPSQVEITTTNPPVTLATKISGRIKSFHVTNKEKVSAGQLLAVMETTASITEISLLKQTLDTIKRPEMLSSQTLPHFSELGELQGFYATFLKVLTDLNNYNKNDIYGNKINSLADELNGIQYYIDMLIVKEKYYTENLKLETNQYRRDSSLYSGEVIAESNLDKSRQALIRINIELQQVRLERSGKQIDLAVKRQLLKDYQIERISERERLVTLLGEAYLNLKAQINIWDNNYLLVSPVDGVVSFTRFWSSNQSVLKDEPVINIVPLETGDFLGRIYLKMQRSGKVKVGQLVNIKLSGYPYMEYGMVKAEVKTISLVPAGDTYVIELDFPDGLKTSYGVKLNFTQRMQGTAEIITEDIRLLQKIVNPFRYLISKNKR